MANYFTNVTTRNNCTSSDACECATVLPNMATTSRMWTGSDTCSETCEDTTVLSWYSKYLAFNSNNSCTTTASLWFPTTSSVITEYVPRKYDPLAKIRDIIASRMSPIMLASRKFASHLVDEREVKARQTLKMIIGDEQFRRFLKNGFVSVQNPQSGRTYQIFPGHGFTSVWEDGKLIERLCVVLSGNFTATDHLIVRYMMAINDETRLWTLANKHGIIPPSPKVQSNNQIKNLVQIFNSLKIKAA